MAFFVKLIDYGSIMTVENNNMNFFEGDKNNPFLVPPGYFAESRAQIMQKIAKEGAISSVKEFKIRTRLLWMSGIAASLLIGLLLFQNMYLKPHRSIKLAQEIDWFINYTGSDLNDVTLASYFADEGISIEDPYDEVLDSERASLLEMTDYDELFIIEEWMNIENQNK